MKIADGFILRNLGEQRVAVAVGEKSKTFNGIIRLNDTAAYIWEKLSKDISEKELVGFMCSDFEIDEKTALNDVEKFIDTLKTCGAIDE